MVAQKLDEFVSVSITIVGPGGDPLGDCRLVGTLDSVASFNGSVGASLTIPVIVANDNATKAYKVVDAIAEKGPDEQSVVSGCSASGALPAGVQDSRVDIVIEPLSSVRGSKTGAYKLWVVVDEV